MAQGRHNFLHIATAHFIGSGVDDASAIQLLHRGIVMWAEPAQRFVPELIERGDKCCTNRAACFGKAAYPPFGMGGVWTLFLDDLALTGTQRLIAGALRALTERRQRWIQEQIGRD